MAFRAAQGRGQDGGEAYSAGWLAEPISGTLFDDSAVDGKITASERFGDPAAGTYQVALYEARAEGTATDGVFQVDASRAAPFLL
ncbi:MAG: hypothetical protein Q9208_008213 [Pyrenodesmia sp. 3 TL-2023]